MHALQPFLASFGLAAILWWLTERVTGRLGIAGQMQAVIVILTTIVVTLLAVVFGHLAD